MSVMPQRVQGPRHIVGGSWRRRVEITGVALAVAPVWVALLAAVALLFAYGAVWAALWLLAVTAAVVGLRRGRRWARWAYWRCRWWADARAGGLCENAERGLFGHDDGSVDRDHLVVAPIVRRLRVTPTGRTYRVRPLATQTAETYEAAAPALAVRWAAVGVRVEYRPGSKYLDLIVTTSVPVQRRRQF